MNQIILASHGSLAEGMASATRMILGDDCKLPAYGLDTYQTPEAIREEIKKQIENHLSDRIFVICDIKGGSVYNAQLELLSYENVYVFSGMNLAMVLELSLMSESEENVEEELSRILEETSEGIGFMTYRKLEMESEGGDELW